MTTTEQFDKKSIFDSIIEAKILSNESSNPRYPEFTQRNFTAGDAEQFNFYRCMKNGEDVAIDVQHNMFKNDQTFEPFIKFSGVGPNSVVNTFKYMFYKFKKGIFVKILDNKLEVFLPFSNKNFVNEWSEYMLIDPKYCQFDDFFKEISNTQGYKYRYNSVKKNKKQWYSNNCLIRYESPDSSNDTNIPVIKNMLETLCKNRKVPNIEFFINKRDFPLLTKNSTEPYHNIYNTFNMPLKSYNFNKYSPILSMTGNKRYADITMPTHDDWAFVIMNEDKKFFKESRLHDPFNLDWNTKKPIAVFRGGSTGCGITFENTRLKLAYIDSFNYIDNSDGKILIDAGITSLNLRPRKLMNEKYLQIPDKNMILSKIKLKPKMSSSEQSNYKYIINVDGHVAAFRLTYELGMNSVILLVDSEYDMWFTKLLIPFVHYIPVKSDLSDLLDRVVWCKQNDAVCKQIALNAYTFYKKYITKDGIMDYMQKLLIDLKNEMGDYKYYDKTTLQIQTDEELKKIELMKVYPKVSSYVVKELENVARNFAKLEGIRLIFNMLMDKGSFINDIIHVKQTFSNKLGTIEQYKYKDFNLAIKRTKDCSKRIEHIHETFIGLHVTNKMLTYIPNFVYNFGSYEQDSDSTYNVITEFMNGITVHEYLGSNEYNFNTYLNVILQLCLTINMSQNYYHFCHNDLTPWNIMLRKMSEHINVDYIVNGVLYRYKTDLMPIIIDYGKSFAIVDGIKYGIVNQFTFNSITDIRTFIITSLKSITSYNLSNNERTQILILVSLFKNFSSYNELKEWLDLESKYSILSMNMDNMDLTPIDMFNHILTNFPYMNDFVKIENGDYFRSFMNDLNPLQYFEYALANDEETRVKSFYNVCERVDKCDKVIYDDKASNIYLVSTIYKTIDSTANFFKMMYKNKYSLDNFIDIIDEISIKYKKIIDDDDNGDELKDIKDIDDTLYEQSKFDESFVYEKDELEIISFNTFDVEFFNIVAYGPLSSSFNINRKKYREFLKRNVVINSRIQEYKANNATKKKFKF